MATHEDAVLMVQLFRWSTEIGGMEAADAVLADGFDPEIATARDPAVNKLLIFGESIATLVKHGLLDRDLVNDTWAMGLIWSRLAPAVRRERQRMNEPRLYENLEALVTMVPAAV